MGRGAVDTFFKAVNCTHLVQDCAQVFAIVAAAENFEGQPMFARRIRELSYW